MRQELRDRRNRATDRHDAARSNDPTRESRPFREEVRAALEELASVAKAAAGEASDPVELARTYRYVGDAHADLSLGGDTDTELARAAEAYAQAEAALGDVEAPVDRAKLDFVFANTLSGQSHGRDIALLAAAQTRYERALQGFREQQVDDLAAAVEGCLATHATLTALARTLAGGTATAPAAARSVPQDVRWKADLPTARALRGRLDAEVAEGRVSPERAVGLAAVLDKAIEILGDRDDGLDAHVRRADAARALGQQVIDPALSPKRTGPEPDARAQDALAILAGLKPYLLVEGMSKRPSEEAATTADLFARLVRLDGQLRASGTATEAITELEGVAWRLADEIQRHARRSHLTLARPDFATSDVRSAPRTVFASGGKELEAATGRLAAATGVAVHARAGRGDRSQERWTQLRGAGVAVFDIGVPAGTPRAQVCYEMGLALALGRPTVVVTRAGLEAPFDVDLRPVVLVGDAAADGDALRGAIRDALGTIAWGGTKAGDGSFARQTLARLRALYGDRLSSGTPRVAAEFAERNSDDAVAFRRAVDQVLGMLGEDAPAPAFPAWPGGYPDAAGPRRCFHVMPFSPPWSRPTRNLAEKACIARGWAYGRGDESDSQRIVPGIWSDIGRASAVLVDVTGANANVALELGLVHALGRPYRIVAQRPVEPNLFDAIAKVRVHAYEPTKGHKGFAGLVDELLADAERRGA